MRGLDARAGHQGWIRGLLAGGQWGANLAPRDSFACFEIRAACLVPCPLSAPFFFLVCKGVATNVPSSLDLLDPTGHHGTYRDCSVLQGDSYCDW